jgi:hypothetical protein
MADKWISGFEPWFLDAAASWARTNGNLDGEQLSTYFQTKLRYIHFGWCEKLLTKLASETPSDPKVAVVDQDTSMALSPIHFVYMDVGCWAGDGEPGWTRHREFGLVNGHVVVLCSFSNDPDYYKNKLKPPTWAKFKGALTSTPMIDASISKHPDFQPIMALLDNLSGTEESIGKLYLLGATMITSRFVPVPARGDADPITVFIGDFHAPVATTSKNAHIFDSGRERLLGRLDMGSSWLNAPMPVPLPPFVGSPKAAWLTAEVFQDMDFNSSASHEAVEEWLRYYHVFGRQTADIFQGAGQDLRTFVDYLRGFHASTWPIKVVQLGDLFDLWLGFRRAFKGSLDNLLPDAMDFARFWVERALFNTEQSMHLTHLLTLSDTAEPNKRTGAKLHTRFLYGNHDNYRKHMIEDSITVPVGLEHQGKPVHVFNAPSHMEVPGMWAEHGHQPDPSNWDQDPTSGHRLTQAAFIEPGIRNIEGFATWFRTFGDGKGIPRTVSIEYAMKRCLLNHINSSEPCRGIYVMGHSHEPMLKRVELWPSPPRKYR